MYLGMPEKICGSKRQVFAYVQDRLNSRVNTWEAKYLSKGGKEVQIKSVAQAVPTVGVENGCDEVNVQISEKKT